MRERDFQAAVVQAARLLGWRVYHTFDSRRSEAGFPDLICLRGREMLVRELKTDSGRLSSAQEGWLAAFQAAGVDVAVWRPGGWETIERELR